MDNGWEILNKVIKWFLVLCFIVLMFGLLFSCAPSRDMNGNIAVDTYSNNPQDTNVFTIDDQNGFIIAYKIVDSDAICYIDAEGEGIWCMDNRFGR